MCDRQFRREALARKNLKGSTPAITARCLQEKRRQSHASSFAFKTTTLPHTVQGGTRATHGRNGPRQASTSKPEAHLWNCAGSSTRVSASSPPAVTLTLVETARERLRESPHPSLATCPSVVWTACRFACPPCESIPDSHGWPWPHHARVEGDPPRTKEIPGVSEKLLLSIKG